MNFKLNSAPLALFIIWAGLTTEPLGAQEDPTPTPVPVYVLKLLPPAAKPSPSLTPSVLPKITVIPNPAWGKKLTFRVMTTGKASVRIRVYNHFLDPIANLSQEGDKFFDLLWSLQQIPEGIYYYQAQVTDVLTGQTTKISVQKFVVLKQ